MIIYKKIKQLYINLKYVIIINNDKNIKKTVRGFK